MKLYFHFLAYREVIVLFQSNTALFGGIQLVQKNRDAKRSFAFWVRKNKRFVLWIRGWFRVQKVPNLALCQYWQGLAALDFNREAKQ